MKTLWTFAVLMVATGWAAAAPTLTMVVDQVTLSPSPAAQQFTLNLTLTSDETFTAVGYSINLSLSPAADPGELKLISTTSPAGVFVTNPMSGNSITNLLGASSFAVVGTTTITANSPTVFLSFTIELKGSPQLKKYDVFQNVFAANNIGVVGENQSVPVAITPGFIAVPEPASVGVLVSLGWLLARRRRAA